ncbi:PAS domain-containing sensor histidine kinase [Brumimicrobium oceani]|uniref:histidine kinase n=1 Tax=Brumimicrobium oceani TaxID=2100725 RepID=A0A2U2X360_9FLAO|nr:histidine kinase dimerization/phosphoacceptor domain -containing protein [Brumimicrobium oceani]PWH82222.1 hypothetical protein DIT68_14040 [Brumimicrobium oceani]
MQRNHEKLKKELESAAAKLLELKIKTKDLDYSSKIPLQFQISKKVYNISLFNGIDNQIKNLKNKEQSKVGRWSYLFESQNLEWSSEVYHILEYPKNFKGDLLAYYFSIIDRKTIERLPEMIEIFNGKKESSVMSQTIITPSGKTKVLSFSSVPLLDNNGELIGVTGSLIDVTDNINGRSGLDNFFNMSSDLHCITHLDTYFLKVSPAWSQLLGYTTEELLSKSYLNFIHPDDIDGSYAAVLEVDKTSTSLTYENRFVKKNGETVYLSWKARLDPLTDLGFCTARDITESKLKSDSLISSLSNKELLLREIHHRVKNNLQIITSLFSLQAGITPHEEHLTQLYQDSKNRIHSMAAIHEMFYESEQLDVIEIGKYLKKLVDVLSSSSDTKGKTIAFTTKMDEVYVNLDIAVPLGLIINEIVTNSIRFGMDGENKVNISISIKQLAGNQLKIEIGDNGVSEYIDLLDEKAESLGILLINSLVEQIDGEIEQLKGVQGTKFTLVFENKTNYNA